MNFLSEIVDNVQRNPFPKYEHKVDTWKHNLILCSFLRYPPNEFLTDIKNFHSEKNTSGFDEKALEQTRIDISLYLVLKNNIQSSDLDKIIQSHFGTSQPRLREQLLLSIIFNGISFWALDETRNTSFQSTEIVNSIHLNRILRSKFERAKELVSIWLSAALEGHFTTVNHIFEIIGAMILLDIGQSLQGNAITTHELFKQEQETFLTGYTLPSSLSIVNNKNYWRALSMFKKTNDFSSFYRDVVVLGLDEGQKAEVKTLLIPISQHTDSSVRELNMNCKFIETPKHDDWETVQSNSSGKDPSLRIIFDYSFENVQLFNQFKTTTEITTDEVVILFNKTNEVFLNYFQKTFPEIYSVLNEFNY